MLVKLIQVIKNLFIKDTKNLKTISVPKGKPEEKAPPVAISLDAYFTDSKTGKDRRLLYKDEYTLEIKQNAEKLLEKVNALLLDLGIMSCRVSSGWRPAALNASVGGAKRSLHTRGLAIDLVDSDGTLDKLILEKEKTLLQEGRPSLLKKYDLWLEDPAATSTWVHLDLGTRSERPLRVFKP